MSKQTEAKTAQGYHPKPRLPVCGTCKYFRSDMVPCEWASDPSVTLEKNMRCGIGGFAVKKMGSCNEHEFKESDR